MAFPVTISTGARVTVGCGGPFISSAGNVYVITVDQATPSKFRAFKATDPSSSFSNVGTDPQVTSTDTVRGLAACQDGDNIHVVTQDGPSTAMVLRYHIFDMSSDSWTTTNEFITSFTAASTTVREMVDVSIRSDGDVIVLYNGQFVLSGSNRERVYYARREGGTWTVDIAVDNGGAVSWILGGIVRGSSDRMHFFFMNDTSNDAYQRCLTSANSLQSFPSSFDTTAGASSFTILHRGTSYDSSGTQKVRFPYFDGTVNTVNSAECDSIGSPTMSVTSGITSPTTPSSIATHRLSFAANGTRLWNTFLDTNTDIFVQSNADDAGWSAPVSVYAGTVTKVYSSVFTRNGDTVLAIVFEETDPKYMEVVLNAAGGFDSDAAASVTWVGADAGSATVASGALSSNAAAAVTWNGTATAASRLTASAAASATFNGRSFASSAWQPAAVATATFVGASSAASASPFSISSTASATFSGASLAASNWAPAAAATVTFAGASIAGSNAAEFSIAAAAAAQFVSEPTPSATPQRFDGWRVKKQQQDEFNAQEDDDLIVLATAWLMYQEQSHHDLD